MRYSGSTCKGLMIIVIFGILNAYAEEKEFIVSVNQEGIQRVEVVAGEYYFDPDHIVVKENIPVEIVIKKTGAVPHSFVLSVPEAGIEVNESLSDEPKTITFTASKAGTYPFYCYKRFLFFKSHRARGMEGVLEVRKE
jgi:plastocyanin domain-containing protein